MGKHEKDDPMPCRQCGGKGKVYVTEYNPKTKKTETKLVTCPACRGRGYV